MSLGSVGEKFVIGQYFNIDLALLLCSIESIVFATAGLSESIVFATVGLSACATSNSTCSFLF